MRDNSFPVTIFVSWVFLLLDQEKMHCPAEAQSLVAVTPDAAVTLHHAALDGSGAQEDASGSSGGGPGSGLSLLVTLQVLVPQNVHLVSLGPILPKISARANILAPKSHHHENKTLQST